MKIFSLVLIFVLLAMFVVSPVFAAEKFSLNKAKKVSKFSLGQLVRTCKGLVIQAVAATQGIRLSSYPMPTQRCHLIPVRYDYVLERWIWECRFGTGGTECRCEDVGLPY